MENRHQWRERLFAAIEQDKRSDRALSQAAGLGPNYIHQMRQRGTAPTLDAATKLCAVLDLSLVQLLTGLRLDAEGEEFVRFAADRSAEERRHLLELLRMMQPTKSSSDA